MKKIAFTLSTFILCICVEAQTQKTGSTAFVLGVVDKIQSVQLSESRTLNIYLPDGYAKDSLSKYPVIYLLDGSADEDFIHIAGLVQYLNFPWVNVLQKSIVVGIANVDRKRDFTFPTKNAADLKEYPTTGGSKNFIAFLEKELQPYIEKKYRTNSKRTIIGQSLGGLLAMQVLLEKPQLFDDYIIISASLWWSNEAILTEAEAVLKDPPANNRRVFFSFGSEGKQMEIDANRFVNILRKASNSKFKVYIAPLPAETHGTILHRAVYRAFEMFNKNE